ncbi:MAG: biotin--[acetyl-CoA-carboxylase] ligase [Thermoanaerobaculia bacterium]|nr:biotin--[acetyl-CoA-carboxylase] ligase [Thermoanaerobaculia bacterium]
MRYEDFCNQVYERYGRTDRGLVVYQSVPSSHEAAQHVVREYRGEGSIPPPSDLVAWTQTRGQGRDGRSWSSPPGSGAYISLIRPDPGVEPQSLPMRVAVALCGELNLFLADACRVRWPNDLMVGSKKIAGILVDLHTQGDDPAIAVISFGVNHAIDPSIFDEPRATTLRAEGGDLALPDLVAALIGAIDSALEDPRDFGSIRSAYEQLSNHEPGETMRIRRVPPQADLEGRFRGFDERGFLRLEVDGQERLVTSGLLSPLAFSSPEH